jgi:hypothetical protein
VSDLRLVGVFGETVVWERGKVMDPLMNSDVSALWRAYPRSLPLFVGSVHPFQFFDGNLTLGEGEPPLRYQAKWRRPTARQRPSTL